MIITIDGPVATGKSTIARKLAESIGFIFYDTGAMYRIVTYGILKHGLLLNDLKALKEFLSGFDFEIKVQKKEKHYFFEGEDVTDRIRSQSVTEKVSEVSALKVVRERLVAIQQELAVGVNAVFEGRDMGSVVFPNAQVKVYLTGRDEVRAKRRYEELKSKYPEQNKDLTLKQCLEEIIKRDRYDSSRECSPLCQPNDAFVVDTSDLTIEEVVFKILEYKDSLKTKRGAPSNNS